MIPSHPRLARLRAFADGTSPREGRRSIAAHLESCPRCRLRVRSLREVLAAARERESAPEAVLDRVLSARAAGDRAILPSGAPGPLGGARRTGRRLAAGALAVVAMVVGGLVLLRAPALEALASDLTVTPATPRVGQRLTVRYHATSRLSGARRLVVRARYYTARMGAEGRLVTLGWLSRVGEGVFEGRMALPDSAVYAVFAVEDTAAAFVDAHGETWDVVVQGSDGRPLLRGLTARYHDVSHRNSRLADETGQLLARVYPGHPEGWFYRFIQETEHASHAAADSISDVYRERYLPHVDSSMTGDANTDAADIASMVFFADAVGDTLAVRRWLDEAYRRFPADPPTIQARVLFDFDEERGEGRPNLMRAYEALWAKAEAGAVQLAFNGFQLAQAMGDASAIERWGRRLLPIYPIAETLVAYRFAAQPSTRTAGLDLLRGLIARHTHPDASERPLDMTAEQYRASSRETRGTLLTRHGTLLLAGGDTAAALDTLRLAEDAGWDPARFRTLGQVRIALGDSASATAHFARVAADPTTPEATADSLHALLGPGAADPARWSEALGRARAELRAAVWAQAVDRRPLLPRLRLADEAGSALVVDLAGESPLVVAFWSRYCGPSIAQLEALDAALERLGRSGVRTLAVTDEEPGDGAAAYLATKDLGLATLFDVERDARNALDNNATPTYVVLSADGRIRFTGHDVDEMLRQVTVLAEDVTPTTPASPPRGP